VAVHLQLQREELETALLPFGVGRIQELRGLPEGSINPNHRVVTDTGVFFARLSTHRSAADLAFEASLLDELRNDGLAVLPPRRTSDGRTSIPLRGGAVTLFAWAAGEHVAANAVSERHLWELGRVLGRLRQLGGGFAPRRENPYGPATVRDWLDELQASGGRGDAEVAAALPMLQQGIERSQDLAATDWGVIHADLFRDNVLWLGERISALLDFEMACTAPAALDPAVTLLDWCWEDDDAPRGAFSAARVRALGDGYRNTAGRSAVAPEALAAALCFAASRFTLSRLRDFHFATLPPEALARKDWREMRERLRCALALGERGIADLWG
jgi:homoserine kinase type II